MERMVATLSVSTSPVAVRSTDWSGVADSQTKRNTDDVGREGKKKGLERKEIRPEDGDEVLATGWRRTERAGGVAPGRIENSGRNWAFATGKQKLNQNWEGNATSK